MGKNVLNAAGMKLRNQKKILEILMTNECSRADLAREIGLTRAAISIIVDELVAREMVIEGNPILGKVGRKSFVLKLNPHYAFMIGINLARDGCHIGVINFCGEILSTLEMPMQTNALQTMDKIAKNLMKLIKKSAFPGVLLGIGVTAPGPIDSKNGEILTPPNFEQWFYVDVTAYFHSIFQCPVLLENNANALALAEKYYGLGTLYKSYAELSVDTGIGCGVVIDGRLYKGSSGFGSDFGHMSIRFDGLPCKCGNIGCAELYASIPNIMEYAQSLDPSFTSWELLVDRAVSGDSIAMCVLAREADYLSIVTTNIMNILDVDAIVMSGSITYKGALLNGLIAEQVNNRFFSRMAKKVEIATSSITLHAPILSAANLILEHFLS